MLVTLRFPATLLILGWLAAGCSDGNRAKLGDPCAKDGDCESGRCDEQVCKSANPFPLGDLCRHDLECRSERCVGAVCVQGNRPVGRHCEYWDQCASGKCEKGFCVEVGVTRDGGPDRGPADAAARDLADAKPSPDTRQLDYCEKLVFAEGTSCKPMGSLKVADAREWLAGCYQVVDLTIDSAGTLKLRTDPVSKKPSTIIAKTLTIEAGGVLHSDYDGYPHDSGPGRGWPSSSGLGSGGGHGGRGGPRDDAPGGAEYDLTELPMLAGSGGGHNGGAGGGAIRICAATKLTVNGFIRARGGTGNIGGAGGTILLLSPEVAGTGTLDASGAVPTAVMCGAVGGGGGGGRIAIRTGKNSFTGTTSAAGGTTTCYSSTPSGQPGTVYSGGLP